MSTDNPLSNWRAASSSIGGATALTKRQPCARGPYACSRGHAQKQTSAEIVQLVMMTVATCMFSPRSGSWRTLTVWQPSTCIRPVDARWAQLHALMSSQRSRQQQLRAHCCVPLVAFRCGALRRRTVVQARSPVPCSSTVSRQMWRPVLRAVRFLSLLRSVLLDRWGEAHHVT